MKIQTPIYDFVSDYQTKDMSRFHMPGHKGKKILGCEERDLTEIAGADDLLHAQGIIAESEHTASRLFGSACTVYSTEGSTLAVKTMIRLAMMCRPSRRFRILAARNVHSSFVHACALLDAEVEWLYEEEAGSLCRCLITPQKLRAALDTMEEKPDAFYVTSPDYLGNMADIRGLADVCHACGVMLLVDNAHGAYLRFLDRSMHPMDLGADMCCDSAHKTLPVLTGGAYLHISAGMTDTYGGLYHTAKKAMSLFASTSPSWLILQSLDLCNAYLASGFRSQLRDTCQKLKVLQEELVRSGVQTYLYEPLKLLIDCASLGMTGTHTAKYLREKQIECEYADRYDLVLMVTPFNDEHDLARLKDALIQLPGKNPARKREYPILPVPKRACTIREAILAPSEIIPVQQAAGRICASPSVSCPPAVPIAVSGEILTEEIIHIMQWYGITEIDTVIQ